MEVVVDGRAQTDRVGAFAFRVVFDKGELTPDQVEHLRAQRAEAISKWLLDQWQREQRRIAESN
ncbi:MAG TPA: hypothetical protein P5572_00630 [Phycisphaerae bacterium]|nr:hypothetical protein [Phycisphaerae bacterium]